nr:reverse transcriptase domain-containing protein [Tanacetum cinerariifolium]
GGTGVQAGRGGRCRRPRAGNDERIDDLNGQGNDQGLGANGGIEGVNGNENVRNVLVNGNQIGCSYKEFLACNPKEYDGKGGAVVLARWIEKMENVQDMSGCSINQKVKYTAGLFIEFCPSHEMQKLKTGLWNHTMVGASHVAYTDRFHELARLVSHLVTPDSRKIERNGSIKKFKKRENVGEPSKDKNGRGDNKRTRIGNVFATNMNLVGRENGCGNQENQARGKAFMLGAEEARKNPNIVMGTFTLNDHYTTTLFDSSADYSFVSTTIIPLLEIEPNDLGFRYEIEIASVQLVELIWLLRVVD